MRMSASSSSVVVTARSSRKKTKDRGVSSSPPAVVETPPLVKKKSAGADNWIEVPGICRISMAPQGGPVWRKLRQNVDLITASRVAYAAGRSPYVTAEEYAYELTSGAKRKVTDEALA